MRLRSDIWVAAYLRRCGVEGASAVLRRRGAAEAGAIFVKVDHLDGRATLYEPAPQSLAGDPPPGVERLFARAHEGRRSIPTRRRSGSNGKLRLIPTFGLSRSRTARKAPGSISRLSRHAEKVDWVCATREAGATFCGRRGRVFEVLARRRAIGLSLFMSPDVSSPRTPSLGRAPPTGLRPAEAFLDAFAQPLADRIAQARGDLARDGGLARLAVAWAAATSPPKTSGRAQPAPHRSAVASPAAGVPRDARLDVHL